MSRRPPIPMRYALMKDLLTWMIIGYTINMWKVGILMHGFADQYKVMTYNEDHWLLYLQLAGVIFPPLGSVLGIVLWPFYPDHHKAF